MSAVVFILINIVFGIGAMQMGGKRARFDRFDGTCNNHKGVKIIVKYYGLDQIGNKLFMNSTMEVKEDIDGPPTLSLSVKRCRSKENLDTCEDFHSFSTNQYCRLVQSKSAVWKPFFSSIEPKWKCPIKKGLYRSINSSFDVTAFLLFPVEEWFWKVKGEMFDGNSGQTIMCVIVEATVFVKK